MTCCPLLLIQLQRKCLEFLAQAIPSNRDGPNSLLSGDKASPCLGVSLEELKVKRWLVHLKVSSLANNTLACSKAVVLRRCLLARDFLIKVYLSSPLPIHSSQRQVLWLVEDVTHLASISNSREVSLEGGRECQVLLEISRGKVISHGNRERSDGQASNSSTGNNNNSNNSNREVLITSPGKVDGADSLRSGQVKVRRLLMIPAWLITSGQVAMATASRGIRDLIRLECTQVISKILRCPSIIYMVLLVCLVASRDRLDLISLASLITTQVLLSSGTRPKASSNITGLARILRNLNSSHGCSNNIQCNNRGIQGNSNTLEAVSNNLGVLCNNSSNSNNNSKGQWETGIKHPALTST